MDGTVKQGRGLLHRLAVAGVMAAAMAGCAQTGAPLSEKNSGTVAENITARYPAGSIQSVEAADRALAEVSAERAGIKRLLAQEERACYDRFFTNRCLSDVREREHSAMEQLQRVEVEANAFKRRDNVARRDERLMQREQRRLPIPTETAPSQERPE